jgi:hypothetical protein
MVAMSYATLDIDPYRQAASPGWSIADCRTHAALWLRACWI